jgi:cytoskeleton protein RodZ
MADEDIIMSAERPGAEAGRVGAGLREMRERLGWKLPDVAESLRIRLEYLEAIEAGDLAPLPGPAYRQGFVRAYAQLMGLDGEEILRRFRAAGCFGEASQIGLKVLAPVPERGVPRGVVSLAGVLAVLIAYGFWYHYSDNTWRQTAAVRPVPAELAPLALPPVVKPASEESQAASPSPAQPEAAAPAPAPAASPAPPAAPAAPPAPQPEAGMVITATQDAWVQVQDPTGNILFSKVLHAGDSWPVPQMPGLTMTTGNAGGTEIITNGTPSPPLGAVGVVLHNYVLTPPAEHAALPAASPNPGPTP